MDGAENAAAAADEHVALAAMYGSGDAAVSIFSEVPSQFAACCRACLAAGAAGGKAFAFSVAPCVPDLMAPLLLPQPLGTVEKLPRFSSVALLHNLAPIAVCGVLPAAYPSHAPPTICVHAPWLTADDAAAIAARLVALWAEMPLMMAGLPCDAPLPVPAGSLVACADRASTGPAALTSTSEGFSPRLLHCGQREAVWLGNGSTTAAALPASLMRSRSRHTCQRVSFPSCGAAVHAAAGAADGADADHGDSAHSHWGFERIVHSDYSCAQCERSPGAEAAAPEDSSGHAGGGGAVCLFSWVEWLRSESVLWLLRRAKLLVRAAAAATAGHPERMVTADDDDASQGLTPQAAASLAAKGLLPQTSFQPMIVGQPQLTVMAAALSVADSESSGAPVADGTAAAAAEESSSGSLARMLSPLQQEAIQAIAAESAAGSSDVASTGPASTAIGGAGRSQTGGAAATARPPASKGGSASTPSKAAAAAGKTLRAHRGSMHWLPPHNLVAGRFAPPAGLVEPSPSRKAGAATGSHAGAAPSGGAGTAPSGGTGTAPASPAAGTEPAVVWVLAPGGGPLPQHAGGDAAAAARLLSWMPSDCVAQVALASAAGDADASSAGSGAAGGLWRARAAEARRCFVTTVAHDAAEEER